MLIMLIKQKNGYTHTNSVKELSFENVFIY